MTGRRWIVSYALSIEMVSHERIRYLDCPIIEAFKSACPFTSSKFNT
jgi:hypothetical protein